MELNKKERKLLSKLNKMCKRKRQWYSVIVLMLFVSIIYLLIFINSREGEHLLMSILFFFMSLYALDTLKVAQLLKKIYSINLDKNISTNSSS